MRIKFLVCLMIVLISYLGIFYTAIYGQSEINCETFFSHPRRALENAELYNLLSIEMSDDLLSVAAIRLTNGQINDDGCLYFEVEIVSTNNTTYGIRAYSANGRVSKISQTWIDATKSRLSMLTVKETRTENILLYPDSHIGIQLNKWGFDGPMDTYSLRFTDLVQTLRLSLNQGLLSEEPGLNVAAATETITSALADVSGSPELSALSLTINAVRAGTARDPQTLAQAVFDWGSLVLKNPSIQKVLGSILVGNLNRLLDLADFYTKFLEIRPIWNDAVFKPDGVSFDLDYPGSETIMDGNEPDQTTCDFIVFNSYRELNHEIYIMQGDGSGLQRLTFSPKIANGHPSWSPDGIEIAMSFAYYASKPFSMIYLMNADGSDLHGLIEGFDSTEPSWSPDGKQIAFRYYGEDILLESGSLLKNGEIYVISLDGNNLKNLTNTPDAIEANPRWSPDGKLIAYERIQNDNHDIYVMNSDGSDARNLTRFC